MRAAALFSMIVSVFGQFQVFPAPAELLANGQAASAPCVHATLTNCQVFFNNALGLTSNLDWTDVSTMESQLSAFYIKGIDGVIQVCNARTQFQACLGDMYSSCMSVTRFVSDGEDPFSAASYVQMFNEIEFDCVGGFVQLSESYGCIMDVWQRHADDLNNCVAAFNRTMATDPTQYCQASYAAEKCTRTPFQVYCGAEASWWQCERVRLGAGLDQYCPSNYCQVQQSAQAATYKARHRQALQEMMQGSEARNRVMKKLAEKARHRERKMRSLVLLATSLAVSSALMDQYTISDPAIQVVAISSQPSNAAISPCIDMVWNSCQYGFDQATKLNTSLDYNTGTEFFNQVNGLLDSSIQNILNVCKARTQFYQCLGSSYYTCMNLLNILQKPNVDYQNAFDYSRAFLGMEFMCTAGFETVVTDWGCIKDFQNTKTYKNCLVNFNEMLPPDQLCPSVKTVSQCLFDAYKLTCVDSGVGFFGCENFRTTFDQTCYGVRCDVS